MADQYQSSFRMDKELGKRLKRISAVTKLSVNQLLNMACLELVSGYEEDPEYQQQRADWVASVTAE